MEELPPQGPQFQQVEPRPGDAAPPQEDPAEKEGES
jgi:hypothetical protein